MNIYWQQNVLYVSEVIFKKNYGDIRNNNIGMSK